MPFKENLPAGSCPALPGATVLSLEGPGAVAFAQAQFMGDVAALAPGQWQWNGWLTPKGRVIALFALVRTAEAVLWLVLPDLPATVLAPRLQRFVFRSKVELRARADVIPTIGPARALPVADRAEAVAGEGLALDAGGRGLHRQLLLLPSGHPALAPADPAATDAWQAADIALGFPRLPGGDEASAWTPQMLSLDRLAAFSLRKGCYPGQEIVARTHYLGQAKRELVRISGRSLAPGQPLSDGAQVVGSLVCSRADGTEALAVAGLGFESGVAGEHPAVRLPLVEGLRRPR